MRPENQDAFGEWEAEDGSRLFVVADGMGGHRGGGIASRLAVATIGEEFLHSVGGPLSRLRRAFELANECVYRQSIEEEELSGMGTTAVVLLVAVEGSAWIGHVGDSRAYLQRGEEMRPITRDHSVVAELVRSGQLTPEQALTDPRRNQILRAIGTDPSVEVEVNEFQLETHDRLLLCTDGLSGVLSDLEMGEVLGTDTTAEAVRKLVDAANLRGGPDNITAVAVHVAALPAPGSERGEERERKAPPPWRRRAFLLFFVLLEVAFLFLVWQYFGAAMLETLIPPEPKPAISREHLNEGEFDLPQPEPPR